MIYDRKAILDSDIYDAIKFRELYKAAKSEIRKPEVKKPEVQKSEAQESEAKKSEIQESEAEKPEAQESKTDKHEAQESEVQKSGVKIPEELISQYESTSIYCIRYIVRQKNKSTQKLPHLKYRI